MEAAAAATSFGVLLQILLLDLLLSGDNALVIALACRRLPPEKARGAAWLGAAGAIGLRLFLTLMTGELMSLPFLQFVSAVPLLVISINLMQDEELDEDALLSSRGSRSGVLAAAGLIIVSDATMSLDNVVALAAVSGGNFWLLAFGLGLSIPLIIFGSFGFSRLMKLFPLLIDLGAAFLGWVAGDMIVGDPLFSAWVKGQAPAVGVALPLACAIFVLAQGRMMRARAKASGRAPREVVAAAPLEKISATQELSALPSMRVLEDKLGVDNRISDGSVPESEELALAPASRPVADPPPRERALAQDFAIVAELRPEPVAPAIPEAIAVAAPGRKETGAEGPEASAEADDRWMLVGLVALFVVFGLVLAFAVALPDF